jgi:hypothetical protein
MNSTLALSLSKGGSQPNWNTLLLQNRVCFGTLF